jgi:S-DNA-T family DNA segregation ATPase FtsK/SpoIIIE
MLKLKVAGRVDEPEKVRRLRNVLSAFKINCGEIKLTESEYFDTYDVSLAPGVRSSKLDRALTDIGLALRAHACPRGYPVLSRGIYRIEVQLKELMAIGFDRAYCPADDMYAPIALGVNADGTEFCIDLQKLPNLLIGGIPGSGKSVLLHSIIFSLLKARTSLYLVDPKMVEFNVYEGANGVKAIENDIPGVELIIETVTQKMEERFNLLKKKRARDIHDYNRKVPSRRLEPIVIIIDEWADIILQNKKIQEPLCRIAQKGRAAGISIVLATQRPSSRVISGLIKANFSGRIGLRVASNVDSRVILDKSGAEKIEDIGVGLYLDQSMSEAKMFRATWIKDIELEFESLNIGKKRKSFWGFLS